MERAHQVLADIQGNNSFARNSATAAFRVAGIARGVGIDVEIGRADLELDDIAARVLFSQRGGTSASLVGAAR